MITFPTLLAVGFDSVTANVSNNIGLVPGSLSGVVGYRRELQGQRARLIRLGCASIAGGVTGAVLLLTLPSDVFDRVVPVLILVACILVAVQPRVSRWLAVRRGEEPAHGGAVLLGGVYLTGIYGGYFGAAQGVILMALLSIFLADHLQRLNGAKNVLAMLVNGTAAVIFVVFADVAWEVVGLIALGSTLGGQIGATVGRRLPQPVLRAVILVVGTTVAIRLLID